ETLLRGLVADPEQRLAELPLLPEAEWQRVVVGWNQTQAFYPKERCIHEIFEAQVEQTPAAVAVVYEEEHLSYGALNARANQLAHTLQALGVGPERLVGICLERSAELVVGLLGVLKAGGAYVPLDPSYPEERLTFMLEDAQAQVLLTQAHLAATLPQTPAEVLCLDSEWGRIAQASTSAPMSGVNPKNLAYMIYTSGSTGRPKGVLVPHKGLLNLTFWHQGAFEVTSSDRATQLAALAFDASVWEIWPYLSKGASLYLVNSETLNSPVPLRDWLVSKAVTISFLPTPLAEMVLPLEWPEATALRILLTGGDKLHQYPSPSVPFRLINNYGPTENTVVATSGVVASEGRETLSPSIGRPIANTELYLLDPHLQPVPLGVPGELYIGGAGLARGYLHR
ncbi:MAG: non-ribosomal peptide synthetase, partial [Gammaproteobacteria bacterium]